MPKPVYEASDGTTYPTAKLAENRDALLQASRELETIVRTVTILLAESAMTADGQQLDLSRSRDYWRIVHGFGNVPRLHQMSLYYAHNLNVDMEYGDGHLVIREFDHQQNKYYSYKVCELYAEERNAQAALVVHAEEALAALTADVAEIKKKAKGGSR